MRTIGVMAAMGVMMLAGCRPPLTESDKVAANSTTGSERAAVAVVERQNDRRRHSVNGQASNEAGEFDFYLLNLSWSPEFCATHPGKAECAAGLRFTLHGLWPQNFDGSYPEHCSNLAGPARPQEFAAMYPDAGLLEHEWETHGTCSGLGPDEFLKTAERAERDVVIPPVLEKSTTQMQMTPEKILAEFVKVNPGLAVEDMALSCGNNRLTAVEVCLSKDLKPVSCQGVRTCKANVVKVTPPGGAS